MGLLTWAAAPAEGTIDNAENIYVGAEYVTQNGCYMVRTAGIAAKNLGDDIYMRVYAKTKNGIVYSNVVVYSPKKYATNMIGRDNTDPALKALCVAMLNYGAAAQEYFAYKTDHLMNADLTDEQKALVAAYDADLFTGAVKADEDKVGDFTKTDGFSTKAATVSFEGAFVINYYFMPSAEAAGDMTFYYWSAEAYANVDTLSIENVTGISPMTVTEDGCYWTIISGIAAKQLDDTFYAAAVYTDAAGEGHCTGVIAYSLSKYCLNKAVDGNEMQQLAAATAMYGYYAKQYFAA